jgi:hypothetical protein
MDPRLRQVQGGLTPADTERTDESGRLSGIFFDIPGPERLFRIDSEEALFQRIRQEARNIKPE